MVQKTKEEYLKEHKNWGSIKIINFPEKDERLAELVGIILGDGNIHVYKSQNSTAYMLRIAGNSIKDYEYIVNFVSKLCESLFNIKTRIYKHYKHNCIYVIVHGRLVVDFLLEI